jgi:hypothetical protein
MWSMMRTARADLVMRMRMADIPTRIRIVTPRDIPARREVAVADMEIDGRAAIAAVVRVAIAGVGVVNGAERTADTNFYALQHGV